MAALRSGQIITSDIDWVFEPEQRNGRLVVHLDKRDPKVEQTLKTNFAVLGKPVIGDTHLYYEGVQLDEHNQPAVCGVQIYMGVPRRQSRHLPKGC